MNLVIDIGNSLIKTAIFNKRELIFSNIFNEVTVQEIENDNKKYGINSCIISSVTAVNESIKTYTEKVKKCIILNSTTSIPIKNNYSTPETLGNDRLANVVGANALFPKKNVLVIDAGTCMKFDFVNSKEEYLGGAISPGLKMRYKAVHQFTEQLPLLEPSENVNLIGNNTVNSIHSGIVNGMRAEINDVIHQYETIAAELQVILCGGDARYFSNHLKNNIFAIPNLTLQGLNEILLYNQ